MIKRPINFAIGILFLFITVIDILAGKDAFVTILALFSAVVNLMFAFIGED